VLRDTYLSLKLKHFVAPSNHAKGYNNSIQCSPKVETFVFLLIYFIPLQVEKYKIPQYFFYMNMIIIP